MQELSSNIDTIKRSRWFDQDWYLSEYPDVGMLNIEPAEHYLRFGLLLRRNPSEYFDTDKYIKLYPEVIINNQNPLIHYIHNKGSLFSESILNQGEVPLAAGQDVQIHPHEPPFYGGKLFKLMQIAKEFSQRNGDEICRTILPEFDFAFYLLNYHDIATAVSTGYDPVSHYANHGWKEGRNPTPEFNSRLYLKRYPEVADENINPFYHYIKVGRRKGYSGSETSRISREVKDYAQIVGLTDHEVEKYFDSRRNSIRQRLERGVLGDMVQKAAKHDPAILKTWKNALAPHIVPFSSVGNNKSINAMAKLHEQVDFKTASVVIVVPDGRWGGGPRMEGHIARSIADVIDAREIVIIRTDREDVIYPGRFPEGCRHVDFAKICEYLPKDKKERIFVDFLRSLQPQTAFNINSKLFWDVLLPFGKPLAATVKINLCFFCDDHDIYGRVGGYPLKYTYRYFDLVENIITDSHYLRDQILDRYFVPPPLQSKVRVLEAPVDATIPLTKLSHTENPIVYWSGRFDRQKRLDIVFAIARELPQVEFHLWGEAVLDKQFSRMTPPSNVSIRGKYKKFADLDLTKCALWLYTSEWDGVPSILLEVAMTGIPIVASKVGGTYEVVASDLSSPIEDFEDVNAYVMAINKILANPHLARKNSSSLRSRLLKTRTKQNYTLQVKELLTNRIS